MRVYIWVSLLRALALSASALLPMSAMPALVALDLDGTVWSPDMYQLWGGGSPFSERPDGSLEDRRGSSVRLLGDVAGILSALRLRGVPVTWVSCTDEPVWAEECLRRFRAADGTRIGDCATVAPQIFKADKQEHFRRLQRLLPHVPFADMLFFDNEWGNVRSVARLGVVSVHCAEGLTAEAWERGLQAYRASRTCDGAPSEAV